ncbi:ABC transporter permease [Marispirochaeta aestuarii]|uniref:Xylose transport system permease protein XylH n=1 Tax=Marispirochaeta aestuarii TaxID=1963862 RepID=A0A1Y1RVR5_9SPIO|nr:multiple monosaccharide ABC transporter permease [Marispirochaeta aestuarii]ORC32742.1 ABC transporter permease [Marispirochaeta aestuarii]
MDSLKQYFKSNIRQYGMVLALVVIMFFFQIVTGGILLKPANVTNLILQNSYVLILAVGMLLCILTGNIDLSVGSVVAFVGAVSAVMMVDWNMPVLPAILIALLIGIAVGAFHGVFIAYLRIPPFIVTLAGMLIFRGLTMVILKGQTKAPFEKSFQAIAAGYISGEGLSIGGFNMIAVLTGIVLSALFILGIAVNRRNQKKYGFEVLPTGFETIRALIVVAAINWLTLSLALYNGIPVVMVVLFGLVLIYTFITQKTIFGRHIYALGGNEKAAKLSGVKTKRVMFLVYTNMGLLSAVAGMVVAGRLNAATPKAGTMFELDAIAACFIGGASASGGIGTVVGAIVGGLVMGVLNNGMSIMGVSVDWQQAIKGMVLLGAVCFDVYTKSKSQAD